MNFQTILVNGNIPVEVDLDNISQCKKCKKEILWGVTKRAKKMPIRKNEKGIWICHFEDCTHAKYFREGDRLEDEEKQKERQSW